MISPDTMLFLEERLSQVFERTIQIAGARPVSGGSINVAFLLHTSTGEFFFLKVNDPELYPGLFGKERLGLMSIPVRTPNVLVEEISGLHQLLVMEWIPSGSRTERFWENFGQALAGMHQITGPGFGLNYDNYMGSLPQINEWRETWVDFFREQRLERQAKLATDTGLLPKRWLKNLEGLYYELPSIFPEEKPSLVHGDLWSGNFICDQQEMPVLIDPAIYYGHRSVDLAMTTLFGRFHPRFYEAYHAHFRLPENYEQQWEIANLYPLLIHLNLFGGSYLESVTETLKQF
ncbi:fructosamine kinase family protein [Terrimonas sp. NA20]|uniref:Fructosamine kinase family protein n=1 Tax=Terrimonas ginsenosidimutans TaxID=2908004 RepID=A0ABS9KRV7_9BACT|nr:fructosamine kinase family protein [Terrimonas ginsenosidimutans]MCG2615015.1 fructosamine kinase family protein [Terrimonas ginsenosidimutans]